MNGIVYGIKDLSSDEIIYVGSTINLYSRKAVHKRDCFTKQRDLMVYNYIREKTDREHFDECFEFVELHSGEFETRQELRYKEQEFINDKAPRCNQVKAFLTNEELKDYKREYYKKEKWREYQQEYQHKYQPEYQREYHKTEKWREYQRERYHRKKLARDSEKGI